MIFHLTLSSRGDFSDIGECIPMINKLGAENVNVAIDALDIHNHWEWFQKNLFIADLLSINGFFIMGSLEEKLEKKIRKVYNKSVFNDFEKVVLSYEIIEISKRKRKVKVSDQIENTNHIRAILIWEGKEVLVPRSKLKAEFFNDNCLVQIKQIQKVINTNFDGSEFGINRLEIGEIGTITLDLDREIEQHFYNEGNSKGIFVIKENDKQIGYGIIIK